MVVSKISTTTPCSGCCDGAAACCGPFGSCCFSNNSTISIETTWTGGPCGDGSDTQLEIPFFSCGVEALWTTYADPTAPDPGVDGIIVSFDGTDWFVFAVINGQTCQYEFDVNPTDCCGTTGSKAGLEITRNDFNSSGEATTITTTITVNFNECCKDSLGNCVNDNPEGDANCDGVCDSDDPCTDCDPTGAGSVPNDAVASDIQDGAGNCQFYRDNAVCAYTGFYDGTYYCEWSFGSGNFFAPPFGITVAVYFIKNNIAAFTACLGNVEAGKWYISTSFDYIGMSWGEETFGFACSAATGKLSGTHIYSAVCVAGDCADTLTITVDP